MQVNRETKDKNDNQKRAFLLEESKMNFMDVTYSEINEGIISLHTCKIRNITNVLGLLAFC